jgi:hypothetical protein
VEENNEQEQAPENENQEGEVDQAASELVRAVARYREMVASMPGLVPELVQGATLEEVDASIEPAREAYEAISRQIIAEQEARIPAGNPSRSSAGASSAHLRPEAKIALGLRGR